VFTPLFTAFYRCKRPESTFYIFTAQLLHRFCTVSAPFCTAFAPFPQFYIFFVTGAVLFYYFTETGAVLFYYFTETGAVTSLRAARLSAVTSLRAARLSAVRFIILLKPVR